MSISSIIGNLTPQYPIGMVANLTQGPGTGTVSAATPVTPPGPAQTPPAGGLFDALMQALTQSGALTSTTATNSAAGSGSASGTSSGTGASSAQSPQQAMQAFIQNLVTALQSQGTGAAGTGSSVAAASSADTTTSSAAAPRAHHHRGHGGHMSAALQDLIDEVDGPDSTLPGGASAAATTGTGGTTEVTSLQQSFQNLVSSMGGSGTASLSGFLTNFAKDLSGMSAVGNLVNTQA